MRKYNISDDFNHLIKIMTNKNFLECRILCNEIPFFIADYAIEQEDAEKKMISQLIKKLDSLDVKVLELNIYDTIIEILKQTGDWEWYINNESQMDKNRFQKDLQNILDINDCMLPHIEEKINSNKYDILFLTDIGAVYPYIRSHLLISVFSSVIKNKPIVMFYPGTYEQTSTLGATFNLFNKFEEGREYKAANIFEIQGE